MENSIEDVLSYALDTNYGMSQDMLKYLVSKFIDVFAMCNLLSQTV